MTIGPVHSIMLALHNEGIYATIRVESADIFLAGRFDFVAGNRAGGLQPGFDAP